ncbi:MAG TPA: zf-HC2 domain-containing protein [Kofleriaceae bacterium]|nr:zf-HC2 domain-containing protein [Kofleriaceae bacterium]
MLQCNEIDELMMDWLYRELDPSSSQAVEAHVGGCARCTAEIGSLRRTREVFREMAGDEEPPAAVSAILLHEAARRAPAVAPRGAEAGFWDRVRAWFQPLFAHPAAAAMATLVLVAGVAGVLYVRNGSDMAKSDRVATSAATPPAGTTTMKADEPTGGAVATATPMPTVSAEQGAAPAAEPEPAKDAPADGYAAGLVDEKTQSELGRASTGAYDKGFAAERRKPVESKKEAQDPAPKPARKLAKQSLRGDVANAVSGADPLVSGVGAEGTATRGRMETQAPKAPPPAGPSSTTASTRAPAASDGDDATVSPYRDRKALTPEELKKLDSQQAKLSSAVKAVRCNDAARIANDILDRSPEYYVQRNPATKKAQPCQSAISREMSRRQAARSKNVGAGAAQAAPQQQKMKSAPREADEAASSTAE